MFRVFYRMLLLQRHLKLFLLICLRYKETVVLRLANIGENDFDVSDLRTIKLTSKEQDNW